MTLSAPIPFREALQARGVKSLLPTSLTSAELARLAPERRERAMFSARCTLAEFLQEASDKIERILNPVTAFRADGSPFTSGLDRATARLELQELLDELDYKPSEEDRGTIKDLRSDRRVNLILDTNTQMAQGYGQWMQGQSTAILDQWPAQELFRAEARKEHRHWAVIWRSHGGKIFAGGDPEYGRMVALKNTPIWTEISAFGLPYPPFDFNSGMDVRDVDRDEATSLGLIDRKTQIAPQTRNFNQDLQVSAPVREARLRAALLESMGSEVEFDGETLLWKGL